MIVPSGHRVLVTPDTVDEKQGSIYLAVETKERRQNEQVMGTIVAIGKTAWLAFDKGEPWAEVGQRVFYARNGGWLITDPDTKEKFVLLNDEDICATIEKGE
ncbi:MAG: co-chaperone GroES family protein [Clostridia bacterium]|jgi:co-chaperonin GroES (HSP10)